MFNDPWKCFPISGLCRIEMCEWAWGRGLIICADNKKKCSYGVARGPRGGSGLLGPFSWEQVHRSGLSDNDSAIFDISEHVKHDPAIDTNATKNELLFFFVCCYFLLLE